MRALRPLLLLKSSHPFLPPLPVLFLPPPGIIASPLQLVFAILPIAAFCGVRAQNPQQLVRGQVDQLGQLH
jgi:hypothetical protein